MKRCGFSLIELLVVMAILGILVALTMAGVSSSRSSARSLICAEKLRQLSLAVHQYADVWGRTPPHTVFGPSIWVPMVPFLGGAPETAALRVTLSHTDSFGESHVSTGNDARVAGLLSQYFQCPARSRFYNAYPAVISTFNGLPDYFLPDLEDDRLACSYVGNLGREVNLQEDKGGVFSLDGVRFAAVTDGLSKTAMLSEVVVTGDGRFGGE